MSSKKSRSILSGNARRRESAASWRNVHRWMLVCAALATPHGVQASDCNSDVAARQGVSTFSQLLDGQPGSPNQPTLTLAGSAGGGIEQIGATISLTPGSKPFWCNMNLSIASPGITRAGTHAVLDKSLDFGWEQRWRADDAAGPTISTFVNVEVPIDSPGQDVQITLEGVLARTLPRIGTIYLNAIAQNDDGRRPGRWYGGLLAGWQIPLKGGSSIILDGGILPGSVEIAEISWQRPIGSNLTFGPGLSASRQNGKTTVSAGLALGIAFGSGS